MVRMDVALILIGLIYLCLLKCVCVVFFFFFYFVISLTHLTVGVWISFLFLSYFASSKILCLRIFLTENSICTFLL